MTSFQKPSICGPLSRTQIPIELGTIDGQCSGALLWFKQGGGTARSSISSAFERAPQFSCGSRFTNATTDAKFAGYPREP
jgi:hypothetical protein